MTDNTFNMRDPQEGEVAEVVSEAQKRQEMKENLLRYKEIASLIEGNDTEFKSLDMIRAANLAFNREKITFGEYEKLFPEQFRDAAIAGKERSCADNRDYNPNSPAKWRNPGFLPTCISELFQKVYETDTEKRAARNRFWNIYTDMRVKTHK